MPVKKNLNGNDWCMGAQCGYKTKSDAEAAERAYYASMENKKTKSSDLIKSLDEDKRLFSSVVIKANYRDLDADGFEDYWPKEVVEQAAHDFMLKCQQGNIFHSLNVNLIKFVESYIAPCDFEMGNGVVNKGDWVATAFIPDDTLWAMCKSGDFQGFSVGCGAIVEEEE